MYYFENIIHLLVGYIFGSRVFACIRFENNKFKPITARCLLLRSDTVCLMRKVATQKEINCIIMHENGQNPNGSKDLIINNNLMGILKMRSCQKQVLIAASFLVAVGMPKRKHEKMKIFMTNERINKHFRPQSYSFHATDYL